MQWRWNVFLSLYKDGLISKGKDNGNGGGTSWCLANIKSWYK